MFASLRGKSFARALRIAGYNRALYAGAAAAITVGVVAACLPGAPLSIRWLGAVGAALAGWFGLASFCAFHWMFDRSSLLHGQWLKTMVFARPGRWVQINAGLEETTLPMADVFPRSEGKTIDLYDPAVMTEPAVTRARQINGRAESVQAACDSLPVANQWADLAVVTLAAHEIRDGGQRERFYRELRRIVSPQGKVLVIEHLRDLAAALAFGPGVFHFFPRSEWLRLGDLAGLEVEREQSMTPFIRVFVYRPTLPAAAAAAADHGCG